MTIVHSVDKLIEKKLNLIRSHYLFMLIHIFLHVIVVKVKDQMKFFIVWDVAHFT